MRSSSPGEGSGDVARFSGTVRGEQDEGSSRPPDATVAKAAPLQSGGLSGTATTQLSASGSLSDASSDNAVPPSLKPIIHTVAPRNDDPWANGLRDRLNVEKDARAFARLALLKSFDPPLAVGIFGRWGAGKSFFMRLISDHVGRLKSGNATSAAPEASNAMFHTKVAEIRKRLAVPS